MLIPSIDLRGGRAVRLRQGRELVLTADEDPRDLAERFGRAGEITVIDLDAAQGTGDNEALVADLCARAPCRVGGGIRDHEKARRLLKAGAERLIIGTAAAPEFLSSLPRSRLLAAVDARDNRVASDGWTTTSDETPEARARRLGPHVAGFLFSLIEREGTELGADLDRFTAFRHAVDGLVTVAGGVTQVDEVVALDRAGMDAQVGVALYRGRFSPGACVAALVDFGVEIGTVPTVVQDARDGRVLLVARSTPATLEESIETGEIVLHARRRGPRDRSEAAGGVLRLVRTELDCDRDAILFHALPSGPACRDGTPSCFGERRFSLAQLEWVIRERAAHTDASSYTAQLFDDPATRRAKIVEEAAELVEAANRAAVRGEAADLVYHTLVHVAAEGLTWRDVLAELSSRRRSERVNG